MHFNKTMYAGMEQPQLPGLGSYMFDWSFQDRVVVAALQPLHSPVLYCCVTGCTFPTSSVLACRSFLHLSGMRLDGPPNLP